MEFPVEYVFMVLICGESALKVSEMFCHKNLVYHHHHQQQQLILYLVPGD